MEGKSINALCRICLNDSFRYSNIYVGHSAESNPIYEVINYVYDLQICVDDGLPEYVCYECLSLVSKFEMYKMNAHKAKSELLLLKQKIYKEENCFFESSNDDLNETPHMQSTTLNSQVFIKQEKAEFEETDENHDITEPTFEPIAMPESQPEESQLQFVNTEKRKRKLYLEGHLYFKDKEKDEKIYWKCEKYQKLKCKARVMTVGNNVLKRSNEHNHTTDDSRVEASKILSIIQASALNSTKSPHYIISKACVGFSQDAIASLPKIDAIKRTIRNIRIRFSAGIVDKPEAMFLPQYSSEGSFVKRVLN